jgi:2-succinyl-6-hydroxy-2,4-cyclohexadiene-1-carboxylate synthase
MWLLLHGFTGSPASWEPVLSAGAFEGAVVAPFLLGHGPDWQSVERSTFIDEVDRLAELVAGTGEPRFVGGYSLGARIGAVLLARHPRLFAGAVFVGARLGLTDSREREARRQLDARHAATLRRDGLSVFIDSWEKQPLFETQRALPPELLEAQRAIRGLHDPEGLARSLEVLGLSSMPSEPTSMASSRVTLMTGERDSKFRDLAARIAADHGGLRLVSVEGAGHNLLLEAPDAVAREMSRIASDTSAGDSP